MMEWIDTKPHVTVLEAEYQRLLGFPADYTLEGRTRELADWAQQWYAENGRPWIYAREVHIELTADEVRIDRETFRAERLRMQLSEAQAERAVLVAVSAGSKCEERARELWLECKPDEYFFLEVFGSAVVEHLVTNAGSRICAWAEEGAMAVLPHYSPGYSGWDTADQNRLFGAILAGAGQLPGELRVMESGMLQPKKSLLAVFGLTQHLEKVRHLKNLILCETCSFSPCQYRRAPYRHFLPQLEDVRGMRPREQPAPLNARNGFALQHNARYRLNPRALRKWAEERLELRFLDDDSVEARFRYEGTTCSNLGRPLAYEYAVKLAKPDHGYEIVQTSCAPAPNDSGHEAMCEYINNREGLASALAKENPLTGRSLNEVLRWDRPFSPAGCYCDADSRMHKWGLVFEVIHYALAKREAALDNSNEVHLSGTQSI